MRDPHADVSSITVAAADLGEERQLAHREITRMQLPRLFAEIDGGRHGFTHTGLDLLTAIEDALALAHSVSGHLTALFSTPEGVPVPDGGFPRSRELRPEERLFVALFATYSACVEGAEATAALTERAVRVANTFDLADVRRLMEAPSSPLCRRLLEDLEGYIRFHTRATDPELRVDAASSLARCVHAYFLLMMNTVLVLAGDARLRHLRKTHESMDVFLLGRRFSGFAWQRSDEDSPSGLLDVRVEEIVGNQEYLRACLRTARDVAGFDFSTGRNPKTINPVLFALGPPGCGKTVTAHAVGRYFLDFCRQREILARFLIIRRTDWASSYQNASANALVRIFTEEVGRYEGVVGVYWPDIDTAFAARDDPGIRAEERNILGACFGIFDGTLLEPNGKWFMMADANQMSMDEATISRITQDPHVLSGATTPEEVVRLLRDVKLRHHRAHLGLSQEDWLEVAARCRELGLSGRSLANIARRIIAEIEDFEYPDEYYRADFERRTQIIAERSRTLDATAVSDIVERYGAFEQAAAERATRERFERRVEEIVLSLSAQTAALERYDRTERRDA